MYMCPHRPIRGHPWVGMACEVGSPARDNSAHDEAGARDRSVLFRILGRGVGSSRTRLDPPTCWCGEKMSRALKVTEMQVEILWAVGSVVGTWVVLEAALRSCVYFSEW